MAFAPQRPLALQEELPARLGRVAAAPLFQHAITGVILLAAVLVGVETYPSMVERYGIWLDWANRVVLLIFCFEIAVKLGSHGRNPLRFFQDGWNVFDFVIVAVCLLPVGGGSVTVLRVLRLLRVMRLVRALPKLQVLVNALLKSAPSMGYVTVLLSLVFYVYGVAGVFFFGGNDPVHFGSLGISLLSLFRVVTLEDWTDIMYIQMYGCDGYGYGGIESLCTASEPQFALGMAFFVSFVLLGTMIMLNLCIGVIMTGMDEAQQEQRALAEAGCSEPARERSGAPGGARIAHTGSREPPARHRFARARGGAAPPGSRRTRPRRRPHPVGLTLRSTRPAPIGVPFEACPVGPRRPPRRNSCRSNAAQMWRGSASASTTR